MKITQFNIASQLITKLVLVSGNVDFWPSKVISDRHLGLLLTFGGLKI